MQLNIHPLERKFAPGTLFDTRVIVQRGRIKQKKVLFRFSRISSRQRRDSKNK